MEWLALAGSFFKKIPIERLLFPPRDMSKDLKQFMDTFQVSETEKEAALSQKATIIPQQAQGVAQSGSTAVVTREGVDQERMAWQDGILRGELWLLEGHLKNNCQGCGGDVECCWKHTKNVLDAARETQSMTSEPLYREVVSVAEHVLPFVHPEDVKAEKYASQYPTLTIEVSKVRTQFDKRVMGYARKPLSLEEAKNLAAEAAAKEVERKWHSYEKR